MSRANSASEKCGVPRLTAASGVPSGTVERRRIVSRSSSAPSRMRSSGSLALEGVLQRRRLRREADRMEHGDGAGRCGDGAERLQVVLRGRFRQADDRRYPLAAAAADDMADRDGGKPRLLPLRRQIGDLDQDAGAPVLRDVQAVTGEPSGDGAAKIDEVAIAVRPRADHRIGEHDGVRFRPGDLGAESRPEFCLVGRTGEGGNAAELLMRPHEAAAGGAYLRAAAEELGMHQVHGPDIERRRHAHAAAEPHQMLHEIEADLTVIEATVDMGGLGVDEALGAHGFGEARGAGAWRSGEPRRGRLQEIRDRAARGRAPSPRADQNSPAARLRPAFSTAASVPSAVVTLPARSS